MKKYYEAQTQLKCQYNVFNILPSHSIITLQSIKKLQKPWNNFFLYKEEQSNQRENIGV